MKVEISVKLPQTSVRQGRRKQGRGLRQTPPSLGRNPPWDTMVLHPRLPPRGDNKCCCRVLQQLQQTLRLCTRVPRGGKGCPCTLKVVPAKNELEELTAPAYTCHRKKPTTKKGPGSHLVALDAATSEGCPLSLPPPPGSTPATKGIWNAFGCKLGRTEEESALFLGP